MLFSQSRLELSIVVEVKILQRWTEYCLELCNYELNGDESVLDVPKIQSNDSVSLILKSEI